MNILEDTSFRLDVNGNPWMSMETRRYLFISVEWEWPLPLRSGPNVEWESSLPLRSGHQSRMGVATPTSHVGTKSSGTGHFHFGVATKTEWEWPLPLRMWARSRMGVVTPTSR